MAMPMSVARWLLFNLNVLKNDDMSPDFFPGGIRDDDKYSPRSSAEQQLAVDMIYRCLKCKLISITPKDWLEWSGLHSIEDFVQKLAQVNQCSDLRPGDAGYHQYALDMGVWLEPQLYCTEVGAALVSRYVSDDSSLEEESKIVKFNNEICDIFEANGVPWTEIPMMRLRTKTLG